MPKTEEELLRAILGTTSDMLSATDTGETLEQVLDQRGQLIDTLLSIPPEERKRSEDRKIAIRILLEHIERETKLVVERLNKRKTEVVKELHDVNQQRLIAQYIQLEK